MDPGAERLDGNGRFPVSFGAPATRILEARLTGQSQPRLRQLVQPSEVVLSRASDGFGFVYKSFNLRLCVILLRVPLIFSGTCNEKLPVYI